MSDLLEAYLVYRKSKGRLVYCRVLHFLRILDIDYLRMQEAIVEMDKRSWIRLELGQVSIG